MYKKIKTAIQRNLINALGYNTKRKFVVIESDDWGAIRMPSKEVYNHLLKKNIIDASNPFTKYDSLASEDDLSLLFEVLQSKKDNQGNSAVITANTIMANPDFEKIQESNFQDYYFEDFTETLKKYPKHANSYQVWNQGIENQLFVPQLHGREHVNVSFWLKKLKAKDAEFLEAFQLKTYALEDQLAASLRYTSTQELAQLTQIVNEASSLFKEKFGYTSHSFIAPNYCWNAEIENSLFQSGIKYLQGTKKQNITKLENKTASQYHYTGQTNKLGQKYLVRNCLFEPSVNRNLNYVDICMKQIENSFYWNKPAIIASHRLNYIGFLDEKNRDTNLKLLKQLLNNIIVKWPEVEFISTAELTKIMK